MSAIEFVGRVSRDRLVMVAVELRGKYVGELRLELGEWDQLRDDCKGIGPGWLTAIAATTRDQAEQASK